MSEQEPGRVARGGRRPVALGPSLGDLASAGRRMRTWATFSTEFSKTANEVIGRDNPAVGESQYRRWTSGQVKTLPSADACRVLEHMFGVDAATLFAPPTSSTEPDVPPAVDLEAEIALTAQDDAGAVAASSASDLTVDQLRDDVRSLARDYSSLPVLQIWQRSKELRERLESSRDRTAVPAQQQELLVLAGKTSALLAVAGFDLGSLDGAKRPARTAALYGEAARHEPLRAYAGGSLAYIAYYSGSPSEATVHARHALTYGSLGDVAVRRLRSIEARAYGHVGDEAAAQRALAASEDVHGDVTDELHDAVGGESGFGRARLAMSNAATSLLLGDGATAETSALHALTFLAAMPARERSPSVLGKSSADLAMARLVTNNLEGAAEALEAVLSISDAHRGTGLVTRAQALRHALKRKHLRGSVLAGELGERLEDFARTPGRRQLAPVEGTSALEL